MADREERILHIVQKKKQACKQALEGMKELAEAALNALLEDKK